MLKKQNLELLNKEGHVVDEEILAPENEYVIFEGLTCKRTPDPSGGYRIVLSFSESLVKEIEAARKGYYDYQNSP